MDPIIPKPPSEANKNAVAITAGAATAAQALQSTVTPDSKVVAVCCAAAFNITFDDDGAGTITDPTANYAFGAGIVHQFQVNKMNTKFKAITAANQTLYWWFANR